MTTFIPWVILARIILFAKGKMATSSRRFSFVYIELALTMKILSLFIKIIMPLTREIWLKIILS